VAENNRSPRTAAGRPAGADTYATSTLFSMSRGTWPDPALAELIAPPVTVTAYAAEAAPPARRPGRHRAPGGPFEPPARHAADLPTWRDLAGALAPA
jgi:hypothetical protein